MEPASEQISAPTPPRGKARVRTCVGCGEKAEVVRAGEPLIRLILGPGGVIAVDPGDGGFGRGVHVHPRPECLSRAVQRGLPRAAKGPVRLADAGEAPLTTAALAQAIREALDRRIEGLVRAAVRSRAVAIGADAVSGACARGEAQLVLVACDAAAGAELPEVQRAIAGGRAAAWGTKGSLGVLVGGRREQGVAVVAITSARIAAALGEAVRAGDAADRLRCASAGACVAAAKMPRVRTPSERDIARPVKQRRAGR